MKDHNQLSNEELAKLFVDDSAYYGDRSCVTNSLMGQLKKGPAALEAYLNQDQSEYVKPFAVGNLIHTRVLEPEKVDGKFFVYDYANRPSPTQTMRAAINKEWELDEIKNAQLDGFIPVEQKDWEMSQIVHDKLMSIPQIREKIEAAEKEVPAVWDDFEFGLRCKGKADMVLGDTIIDLKTSNKTDLDGYKSSFYSFDYRRQAAFYSDGFGTKNFEFIFISKEAPYNVGIIEVSPRTLQTGRDEYKRLLERYNKLFVRKEMPLEEYVPKLVI